MELSAIQAYRRALKELRSQQQPRSAGSWDHSDGGSEAGGARLTRKQRAATKKKEDLEKAAAAEAAAAADR